MGSELVYGGGEDGEYVEATELEIRNEHTDGWIRVLEPVGTLAQALAGTEFVPKALRNKPEAVTAAILFGRELAMPPLQSLAQVHMVEGKATLSAEHMRAMVFAAGHEITYPVLKGTQVIARGRRRYADGTWSSPTEVEWNWAMAEYAGLSRKDNWRKYPRAMLEARATGELCRLVFPDVTHGMLTSEEVEDGGDVPEGGMPSSGEPATSKVSRAPRKGTAKPAPAVEAAPPVQSSAAGAPPRPPLPAAKVASGPAAATPGEGDGSAKTPSTVAGPPLRVLDFTVEDDRDLAKHLERIMYDCPQGASTHHAPHEYQFGAELRDCPGLVTAQCANEGKHTHHRWATTQAFKWCEGVAETRQCPSISNGQQCRYAADHNGPHTFGGGLQDPVSNKRCELPQEHDAHAWNPRKGEWFNCAGTAIEERAGVVTDAEIVDVELPEPPIEEGGAAPDREPTISPGALRALGAAFTSLGIKDTAERHHTTSALLGRKIDSWKTLTRGDADRLFKAVENLTTRDELETLVQSAAEQWGQNGA